MRPRALAVLAAVCAPPIFLWGQQPEPPRLRLSRITSPIAVDGDLSDPGWQEATVVDVFYEINPGDNVPPPVKTIARIGYDDRFFYVSFWCQDPDIRRLRAPYVDRDGINDDQDYVGILLDVENTNHSAIDFWIGPTGIQADSVFNEGTSNEDFGPDYFWQSAGRIGADSWVAEIAIPLSSLRYPEKDPQDWALALYRIYPREFNYQLYSVKVPRGTSCFLCQSATVEGITGLPEGMHYVVAPYAAGTSTKTYPGFEGYSGDGQVTKGKVGVDAKWLPDADTIVDATLNPDFSQVESDTAQIAVNERFALFYPEKRPFFLEHVDLLQMPIQAAYTRTITSPFWGARLTGKSGGTNFTALVANDRGGGTVIIPGPVFSDAAPQDFHSIVGITRVRQDVGRSFVGFVGTARSISASDGGGYNYVAGADFQWRPNDDDVVKGQYLYSVTRDPDRPDLYPGWTGGRHSGFAGTVQWVHTTRHWEWTAGYDDFASGFRADDGFEPQVGYREVGGNVGYRTYPTGFFSRIKPLVGGSSQNDREGSLVARRMFPGVNFQAHWGLRGEFDYNFEAVQIDGKKLEFDRFVWTLSASPSRLVPRVALSGNYGEQPDVFNVRVGTGGSVTASAVVRPTDHLGLDLIAERQWIDETVGGVSGRLFTASVARAKAVYVFNSRMLIRLIGQYVETTRDPSLWTTPVVEKEGFFSGSALFSYKLNWQTVLFLGYGDNRALVDEGMSDFVLKPADRQVFLKVSYAFQR
jgi:Domain of unknown function (DUF5916)